MKILSTSLITDPELDPENRNERFRVNRENEKSRLKYISKSLINAI